MDAQAFWNVIGHYNSQTGAVQAVLFIFLISAVVLSYTQRIRWAAKCARGLTNLFIGLVFFAWYGTEPIQKFFAAPLYLLCGSLSIAVYAGYKRKNKALLALLTVWGLTGIKSIIFHAYEDIILLICGFYGSARLVNEIKRAKDKKTDSDSECM